MNLMINISEEDYEVFKKQHIFINNSSNARDRLFNAVKNGTPLPKGHGKLIDADAYRKEMLDSREFDFFKRLDMQPTIIEADKAESEGKE